MEWLVQILHAAAWVGAVILLFAVIGFIATIRWIVGLFWKGEQEVSGAVRNVESDLQKR